MTIMIISLLIGCGNNTMDKVYNDNSKIASVSDTFGLDESKETIEPGIYKGRFKLVEVELFGNMKVVRILI